MVEERRHYIRIAYAEPIQFRIKEESAFVGSLAADIGVGGLRCNSNEFIPLNSQVAIEFDLGSETPVTIQGHIAWVQLVPFSDRYQVGVEFEESESHSDSRRRVHEYIQSHLS